VQQGWRTGLCGLSQHPLLLPGVPKTRLATSQTTLQELENLSTQACTRKRSWHLVWVQQRCTTLCVDLASASYRWYLYLCAHRIRSRQDAGLFDETHEMTSYAVQMRKYIEVLDRCLYRESEGKGLNLMMHCEGEAHNKTTFGPQPVLSTQSSKNSWSIRKEVFSPIDINQPQRSSSA
jgi:hypothetical protein